MAFIAKQEVSLTPRQKVKGPKCGQCEEKKAAVVRRDLIYFKIVRILINE